MGEWQAYSSLEPFGSRHQDLNFGVLGSTVANAPHLKKPSKLYTHKDFTLLAFADRFKAKVKKQSPQAIKDFFIALRDSMKRSKNG